MSGKNSSSNNNSSNSSKIGPRAKCDQVVYEAIAKAGEIIFRSRCQVPTNNKNSNKRGNGTSSSSSSSRFNIEIGEVENVR